MSRPHLSIIIPAHNEEKRLLTSLEQVSTFLQAQPYPAEMLVVENASQDRTRGIACEFATRYQGDVKLHVLQEPRLGKGMAVRLGMLSARGDYRFMCDADLSMPIEEVNRFLPPSLEGADIAIASREAKGAVRYNEPAYRHLVGRVFNTMIRLVALPGLQDTQCGFKCFRAPVAEDVFRYQTLAGWSFDVEVLYIAQKRGYSIVELPIPWYYHANSKISVLRDSFKMALDLLVIRKNGWRGVYDQAL